MDEVFPGLYVGTVADAGDQDLLRRHGVDKVVSLTFDSPESGFPGSVSVECFEMMDGPRNDREVFESAVEKVVELLENGETVLVHCSKGASRSPSVAAASVAVYEGLSIEEAFERVANGRSAVDPHEVLVRRAVGFVRD
ncbi:Dual specificity protein phosphatase [Haloarcula vallismortis ATCC 29715]|uniref:protein-tyrosine-phosphatase n=1 Tax=Haloarcula vallismortis ATCC 29715 TaxID=662477 RepID=M0JQJ1_HALVA|nr:dual specificity protein phosphatase [Haloarcula vallismortis]EMA09925.1 Dual specificity protein phosphatase [Haloarcula vallismortis ATCC 29715]